MNLDRKGVLLKVKEGADHLIDPAASEGELLFGTVVGETVNVGLWVTVLLWAATADGAEQKPPRSDAPNLYSLELHPRGQFCPTAATRGRLDSSPFDDRGRDIKHSGPHSLTPVRLPPVGEALRRAGAPPVTLTAVGIRYQDGDPNQSSAGVRRAAGRRDDEASRSRTLARSWSRSLRRRGPYRRGPWLSSTSRAAGSSWGIALIVVKLSSTMIPIPDLERRDSKHEPGD